jgi:hypothetical protein
MTVERGGSWVKGKVDAGHPAFVEMWNQIGGMERFDRRRRWFAARREQLAATMR